MELQDFLPKLKKCGLHAYSSLSQSYQRQVNKTVCKETIRRYDPIFDFNCEPDSEDEEYYNNYSIPNPDYTFVYKLPADMILLLDYMPGRNTHFSIEIHYLSDHKHLQHLIEQLFGRFKQLKFISIETNKNVLIDFNTRLPNANASFIQESPLDERLIFYPKRKYQGLFKVPGTTVSITKRYDPTQILYELQDVTQYVSFQEDGTYIHFDPPLFYSFTHDTPVSIRCPFANIKRYGVDYPRWNKLIYCSDYSGKYKIYYTENRHYVLRHTMMIPTEFEDDCYQDELKLFQDYANQLLKYNNHITAVQEFHKNRNARIIQRYYRPVIHNVPQAIIEGGSRARALALRRAPL